MIDAILVALVAVGVPSSSCGSRCPCIVPAGVDWHSAAAMVPRAQQEADAVFRGYLVRADTIAKDTSAMSADTTQAPRQFIMTTVIRYTFTVERSWKGPLHGQLVVTNYHVNTSCGRRYKKGISYLIYADKDRHGTQPDVLSTYSCSRVRSGLDADEDLKLLGRGRAPND